MTVYPLAAMEKGLKGKAVISCTITVQGTLSRCRVDSEEPAGLDFGAAALALTPQMLLVPAQKAGKPVESTIRVPVNFQTFGRAEVQPGDRILANVRWREAPTYAQVAAAYPEKAKAGKVGGRAVLRCLFGGEGRLGTCDVAKEEPSGMGFGAAARSLRPLFVGPATSGDRTTRGFGVDLSVVFTPEMITSDKPAIGRPQWSALPAPEHIAQVAPKGPSPSGAASARVVLSCQIVAGGALSDCAVVEETPAGEGYGAATLSLAKDFKLSIWTSEGLPTVGGTVRVPIRFSIDAPAATPSGGR